MVDHVKVGAVDGPSEAVLKQAQLYVYYIIVVSAEEGRAPTRHNSTLSQRGLKSPYRRLVPPIISIARLYHLRRFYAVIHIIRQICAQA